MENILASIKKLTANKNTVTIIGTLLIVVVLYVGYNSRVGAAVEGISLPIANQTIPPNTLITADMVTRVTVARAAVPNSIYTKSSTIIGNYTSYNTVIPEGSFFFEGANVLSAENLPNAILKEIAEGEVAYSFYEDSKQKEI